MIYMKKKLSHKQVQVLLYVKESYNKEKEEERKKYKCCRSPTCPSIDMWIARWLHGWMDVGRKERKNEEQVQV